MEPVPSDEVWAAYQNANLRCMHCGGTLGHGELLHTQDSESMGGFEAWFCCWACRDQGEPCETFHKLTPNAKLTGSGTESA